MHSRASVFPELVLCNGHFRTQDPQRPYATGVAVTDGVLTTVGDDGDVRAMAGRRTRIIDLEGRLVLPGFIDTHLHYRQWSLGLKMPDLVNCSDIGHLQYLLKQTADRLPPDHWIQGQGFNEQAWPEKRLPTCHDLDAAVADRPVIIWREDMHLAVANSCALALAGITPNTPDPSRGRIDRDREGQPLGILRESAVPLVALHLPPPSRNELVAAMREGMPVLHRIGITGIHDARLMGGGDEWNDALTGWQQLHGAGRLSLRCWVTVPGESLEEAREMGLVSGVGDGRLMTGHLKLFADGGMGARTAWLLEPYGDGGCGLPQLAMDELEAIIAQAETAGLAAMVHAVGDRACRELLAVFERVARQRPMHGPQTSCRLPHRIEHVQMIRPEDIRQMARLGIAASVQPANLMTDMDLIDDQLGGYGRYTYTIGNLRSAGIPVSLSSDAPVCPPDPLLGIYAAVTRRKTDGTPASGWYPDQGLTVAQAVHGYTVAPARLGGAEGWLGSITPGKKADLMVLDKDIYRVDPAVIPNTRVVMTVFDGQVVFQA
jgi:predicted amidohydrolase YtcJ